MSFALGGAAGVMWDGVTVSPRQRIVPDALLGRVNASYRLLAWGSQPIGALLGGLVAGLRVVFLIARALIATLLFARRIVTDGAIATAEAEGDAEAARLVALAARDGVAGSTGAAPAPPEPSR